MTAETTKGRPSRPSSISGASGKIKPRHIHLHDDEWRAISDAAADQGRTISAQVAHMAKALRPDP